MVQPVSSYWTLLFQDGVDEVFFTCYRKSKETKNKKKLGDAGVKVEVVIRVPWDGRSNFWSRLKNVPSVLRAATANL